MMLLPYLAFVTTPFAPPQQKSMLPKVMDQIDPNNGYVEYVRAADLVDSTKIAVYLMWQPNIYERLLARKNRGANSENPYAWSQTDEAALNFYVSHRDITFLDVQKLIVQDFGRIFALIKAGNQKRAWDPRKSSDWSTLFPELSGFKTIAKLYRANAYVRFAEGDTRGATAELLDGLTFAHRIGGGSFIGELVSIAAQSLILAAFEENLDHLTERDAQQIVKYVDSALKEPSPYLQSLRQEYNSTIASLDEMMSEPETFLSITTGGPESNQSEALGDFLKNMGTRDREAFRKTLTQKLTGIFDKIVAGIGQDESTWQDLKVDSMLPPDPPAINGVPDAADALLRVITPVYGQSISAELKARAQLRLLGLHARVIAFRWHRNRLPNELSEAVAAKLAYDPIARGPFRYELQADGYKLYSVGLASTGLIELKYKRPPNLRLPGSDDAIPPLTARASNP